MSDNDNLIKQCISEISSKWFYSKPLLYRLYCSLTIEENCDMNCEWRSGPNIIQYNGSKMNEVSKQKISKNLETECMRLILRHPYRVVPSKRYEDFWYQASNMTINQAEVKKHDFEENRNIEYYYQKLLEEHADIQELPEDLKNKEKDDFDSKNPNGEFYHTTNKGDKLNTSNSETDNTSNNSDSNETQDDPNGNQQTNQNSENSSLQDGVDSLAKTDNSNKENDKANQNSENSHSEELSDEVIQNSESSPLLDCFDSLAKTDNSDKENDEAKSESSAEENDEAKSESSAEENDEENVVASNGDEKKVESDDGPTALWNASASVEEAVLDELIQSNSKLWGTLPKNISSIIKANSRAKVKNFQYYLKHFKSKMLGDHVSFTRMKPNRRTGYLQSGTTRKPTTPKILIAIDTSGSVSDKMLSEFYGAVKNIFVKFLDKIDVIHFDTEIKENKAQHFKKSLFFEVVGRGGTNFTPIFEFLNTHNEYEGLIILTDGYAPAPIAKKKNKASVLWVCYEKSQIQSWMTKNAKSSWIKD